MSGQLKPLITKRNLKFKKNEKELYIINYDAWHQYIITKRKQY